MRFRFILILSLLFASIKVPPAIAKSRPLVFDSELIRMFIEGDTLRIEGHYRFLCPGERERFTLFYPYPEDSLLGRAWTESLEWRPTPGSPWTDARFHERADNRGVGWSIDKGDSERPEVLTTYRQIMKRNYARYIVTTTSAWGRPLTHARFELTLPAGARITSRSYPFKQDESGLWVFETEAFLPERDIVIEWDFPQEENR